MLFNPKNKTIQGITPTRPRPPTPIRTIPLNLQVGKENISKPNSNRNTNEYASDKLEQPSIKNKPLINPLRSNTVAIEKSKGDEGLESMKGCPNHPSKMVEFMIEIEDEMMLYCEKCAAQLASQGFEVTKIETLRKVKKSKQKINKNRKYEGSKMYEEIICFLEELNKIEEEHEGNMKKFSEVDNHYNKQIILTENFYDELIKTIENMKEDHLNDLVEESKRHSQIADIQHDYLRENVDEMQIIRRDIQDNLDIIMEKLQQDQLQESTLYESLTEYRQKIQIFRHKVQEQNDIFNEVIDYSDEQLSQKQTLIQEYLIDVWMEPEQKPKQPKRPESNVLKSKQNININYHVPQKKEGNQPFRRLFDENMLIPDASPQFKKF